MQTGVFVTGTDTGVGKTLAAACLVERWGADYWKPLQTGLDSDEPDAAVIARLTGLAPDRIHPTIHQFAAPRAPFYAALAERIRIDIGAIALPRSKKPLVVEGAGGLLVPITKDALMIDLIEQLRLPAVLVARTTLGTINHSLLSLEALRHRGIPIAGVILCGVPDALNRTAIADFGRVPILGELPWTTPLGCEDVKRLAQNLPAWVDFHAAQGSRRFSD